MRRTWRIRRSTVEQADGQACWDRAYQLLLRRAADPPQEGHGNSNRILRPSVDGATVARADDRAAGRPAAKLLIPRWLSKLDRPCMLLERPFSNLLGKVQIAGI